MARLRFVAAGHHNQVCEAFGRKFPHGQWVEVGAMDPKHVETLSLNPTFEHEPDPAPPKPKKVKGAEAVGEQAPDDDKQAEA
jgi:hypothetical protein